MIHYHGSPISGEMIEAVKFFSKRSALISFSKPTQIQVISQVCRSFVLDNGSYSFFNSGKPINWNDFYEFVETWKNHPRFDWFIVPDVIDGTEEENDNLLLSNPYPRYISVPVWHIGSEPLARLDRLINEFPRIAIGTSGNLILKSMNWWNEMRKAFEVVCNSDGIPKVKIHGLKMLDPEIVNGFPFSSCDSAGAVILSSFDKDWQFPYAPLQKSARASLYADYIENAQSPSFYKFKPIQLDLL